MSYPGSGDGSPVFRVSVPDLLGSAARVSDQGADLAFGHLSSDNRIEAAQDGWVGSSAVALTARWEAWLATSNVLLSQVAEHAYRLNSAAITYAVTEADGAAALHNVVSGAVVSGAASGSWVRDLATDDGGGDHVRGQFG